MYPIIKQILFQKDPEKAHAWAMKQLQKWHRTLVGKAFIKSNFGVNDPSLQKEVWNLNFKNPIGLAAGFDKDAKYINELASLGFGFIEIGTLTPRPQPGNDAPRLFRLPKDNALINRMGFNNEGVDAAVERLKNRKSNIIIGGNIGKNKDTPNAQAADDYETCFRKLYNYLDYFVVNVSSPNTPNLRELQEKEPLTQLLTRLQIANSQLGQSKPILLKIAPDLDKDQLDDIIEIVSAIHLDGLILTNTTISRDNLQTSTDKINKIGAGGLSGAPLRNVSTDIIKYVHNKTDGKIPIIGVGGIFDAEDAIEKLKAGASLIQIYTGFIYKGPAVVKNICKKL